MSADPTGPVAEFLALSGWSLIEARPDHVRNVPGRYRLARHRVRARDRGGRERALAVTVETRRRPRRLPEVPAGLAERVGLSEVATTLGDHHVWAFPYDPELPLLPDAVSGPAMRERLRTAGLVDGPALVSAHLLRYRPGRRAVVRYQIVPRPGRRHHPRTPNPGRALFGKVLRHDRSDRLASMSAADARIGPDLCLAIPQNLGGGLFVAEAMAGTSLRDRLVAGGALPSPNRLARIPEALAEIAPPAAGPVPSAKAPAPNDRRHPARRLEYAVGLLTEVLPTGRDAVARAARAVETGLADGWAPRAFTHGDLYDDQVFVADDFSLGLIDLDDAGPGDPALDAANLCAHLLAMTLAAPTAARRLVAYRELVRTAFLERLDLAPEAFAWREALALLLLATGPYRVQAEDWPVHSRHLIDLAVRLTTARPEAAWRTCS
jgi:hypothetical protein